MLDGVSLDQLRTFIAAADEGSFSAAGRRLRRAQSVISQTLANLEGHSAEALRSDRPISRTDRSRSRTARRCTRSGGRRRLFKARAKCLAGGLEPELSVALDVMFPVPRSPRPWLISRGSFRYPARFDVASSAVVEPVLERTLRDRCRGIMVPRAAPAYIEALLTVPLPDGRFVTAPTRGLSRCDCASRSRRIRPPRSYGPRKYFASPCIRVQHARVWQLSHLGAKLAFLRAGLGFGGIPIHLVEEDLANGSSFRSLASTAALRPCDNYVGNLSNRQPARPGRTLVHRAPQAKARSPVARANDLSGGFEGVGLEAPRSI